MGIMPHVDVEQALKLALSLGVPFWPQLPNTSFYEDMYVQASEHFPGIVLDVENKKIHFDSLRFEAELGEYSARMFEPAFFTLSDHYSGVYHRFLAHDLKQFTAIRGQSIGPVSFGFRVTDENNRPIIYNEDVKTILFDFIRMKINAQYRELKEKNKNAFVWLDEPGLSWIFSGLSGYSDIMARNDYRSFINGVEGTRALHLCANVNLPYLLTMGTELLSFDAYQMNLMPKGYSVSIAGFIKSGGVICWGIVPTDSDNLSKQTPRSLADILAEYWEVVSENTGVPIKIIASHALIAPARCCLKNVGRVGASDDVKAGQSSKIDLSVEEVLVEKAFSYLNQISEILEIQFNLSDFD